MAAPYSDSPPLPQGTVLASSRLKKVVTFFNFWNGFLHDKVRSFHSGSPLTTISILLEERLHGANILRSHVWGFVFFFVCICCVWIPSSHAHPKIGVRFKIFLVPEEELLCWKGEAEIGNSDSFKKKLHLLYALLKDTEPLQNCKLSHANAYCEY